MQNPNIHNVLANAFSKIMNKTILKAKGYSEMGVFIAKDYEPDDSQKISENRRTDEQITHVLRHWPLFHVQLSTTTGPLRTNVQVNHRCLSFFLTKPILSEISTFRNFDGGPEFAEHSIYALFALQLSFCLSLHPRLQRLRGPTVWDS